MRMPVVLLLAACGLTDAGAQATQPAGEAAGWEHVGGDQGGSRYSPLAQIDRKNVWRLERAWTWRHGDFGKFPERRPFAGFHATPILLPGIAGGSLIRADHAFAGWNTAADGSGTAYLGGGFLMGQANVTSSSRTGFA